MCSFVPAKQQIFGCTLSLIPPNNAQVRSLQELLYIKIHGLLEVLRIRIMLSDNSDGIVYLKPLSKKVDSVDVSERLSFLVLTQWKKLL